MYTCNKTYKTKCFVYYIEDGAGAWRESRAAGGMACPGLTVTRDQIDVTSYHMCIYIYIYIHIHNI